MNNLVSALNRTVFVILSACVLLGLSGCGSAPQKFSEAQEVGKDRVLIQQCTSSDCANVVFIRELGGSTSARLLVNEELAAQLDKGEKVAMSLPSGEYSFSFYLGPIATLASAAPIDQKLEGGKTYHYRLGGDAMAGPRLFRVIGKSTGN